MTQTQGNILGWVLLGVGWMFHFNHMDAAALPFFGAALVVFILNLARLFR
jgi:hypothetical protein